VPALDGDNKAVEEGAESLGCYALGLRSSVFILISSGIGIARKVAIVLILLLLPISIILEKPSYSIHETLLETYIDLRCVGLSTPKGFPTPK